MDHDIYSDVDVRTSPPDAARQHDNGFHSAAAELAGDPPVLLAVEPEEVKERYIDIVSAADHSEIPLAEGDADLVYDLQATFDRCYDDPAYGRRLRNYEEPAVP